MTLFYHIKNDRCTFAGQDFGDSFKFYHKNEDLKESLLKGPSYKIYTGITGKFLTFFGFAFPAKVKEQQIYVNKVSFRDFYVRMSNAAKAVPETEEEFEVIKFAQNLYNNKPPVTLSQAFKEKYKKTLQEAKKHKDIEIILQNLHKA